MMTNLFICLGLSLAILLVPFTNTAPTSVILDHVSSVQPGSDLGFNGTGIWAAANDPITASSVNLSSLESAAGFPSLNTSWRPPVCSGQAFGYGLRYRSCWEALDKLNSLKGRYSFGWPGYGDLADIALPRRFSSCEFLLLVLSLKCENR